jgi:hypothetical protein
MKKKHPTSLLSSINNISEELSRPHRLPRSLSSEGSFTMGLMIRKPEGSVGSAFPAIMVGLFVAFGGVLFGYVYCYYRPIWMLMMFLDMTLVPLVVFLE